MNAARACVRDRKIIIGYTSRSRSGIPPHRKGLERSSRMKAMKREIIIVASVARIVHGSCTANTLAFDCAVCVLRCFSRRPFRSVFDATPPNYPHNVVGEIARCTGETAGRPNIQTVPSCRPRPFYQQVRYTYTQTHTHTFVARVRPPINRNVHMCISCELCEFISYIL